MSPTSLSGTRGSCDPNKRVGRLSINEEVTKLVVNMDMEKRDGVLGIEILLFRELTPSLATNFG